MLVTTTIIILTVIHKINCAHIIFKYFFLPVISSSLIDLPDIPEVDLSESTTDEDVSVAPVTLSKNGTMNDKVKDIKKGKTGKFYFIYK